jgi:hypothetical protein
MLRGIAVKFSLFFVFVSFLWSGDEVDSLPILNMMRRCARPILPSSFFYKGVPEKRISAQTEAHIVQTHFLLLEKFEDFFEENILPRLKEEHRHQIRRTTIFTSKIKPQEVFDSLPFSYKKLPFYMDKSRNVATSEISVTLQGHNYKLRVGRCVTDNCNGFYRGEVVNLYPICGPEVILVEHAQYFTAKRTGKRFSPQIGVPCED